MDEREYLTKAQEAEAIADAAQTRNDRRRWEDIATEFRRLAKSVRELREAARGSSDSQAAS